MAGKIQIQESFQKIYDLDIFKREILNTVFSTEKAKLFRAENYIDESNQLTASEKKAILKVIHYGNLELDDYNTLKLYEITLQPKVRIEQSKVGIQQYVRKMLIAGEGVLVNFINPDNLKTWRLTLVASDTVLTDKGISIKKLNPKRYTFIVGQSEKCKTITDRFADLETASRIVLYPSENEKNAISLVKTFSVETLSIAFFDEYTLHYKKFVASIENSNFRKSVFSIDYPEKATQKEIDLANKPIRDFVKKLLGRIVFLYFVQKKSWLGASDSNYTDGKDDFIFQLFLDSGANEAFYSNWLAQLFFKTLNEQRTNDVFKMPNSSEVKIPYLNGGLFDPEDYDNKLLTFAPTLFHSIDFEDTALTDKLVKKNDPNHRGFLDFLNSFNFTVHEDSPEDHTVAVDPEMLGHIFENLLEDNKDKGAFYTPKEIVHYMCQESLIEYLNTKLNPLSTSIEINESYKKQKTNLLVHPNRDYEENYADIQDFIKNKTTNDFIISRATDVNKYLDDVKICDPAIGSGAFPMGLLQEIFAIKELIAFETNSPWKPAEVKENIIQNSIYGVDIEKGAVDIARLRFWLSLIVNEEKPKALPNLDYKIVVGNSLLSKFGDQVIDIDWDINGNSDFQKKIKKSIEELVNAKKDFFELKKEKSSAKKEIRIKTIDLLINILTFDKEKYFKTNSKTKSLFELTNKQQKEQLEFNNHIFGFDKAIKELKLLKSSNDKFDFFDWNIDFAEVLNENFINEKGFDIVIANPPYDVYEGLKKTEVEEILKIPIYEKCKGGKLNAFELFLAKTHELIVKEGTNCQIFQNSFLADNSSRNLRDFYFKNQAIKRIDSFPERDSVKKRVFESAKISVCILLSQKVIYQDYKFEVNFWKDRTMQNGNMTDFTVKEIYKLDSNKLIIPNLKIEEKVLFNLYNSNKLQYSEYFECIEGELNMTFHKSYMTDNNNSPLIVKGAQIQRYYVTSTPSQGKVEYVDEQKYLFDYSKSKKSRHHSKVRIALQGISGANDKIRLISTLIPIGIYCANSCNYIIQTAEESPISILCLLGIFNSKITNWIFRKTSTNSNVNCYEVNNLRLPSTINLNANNKLSLLVTYILFTKESMNDFESLKPIFFEQIVNGMVYELYFPELLQQHNRNIIEHLGELPEFADTMSDATKIQIINTVFERLNEKSHLVRVNLFYMNSIPEIAIIEGKKD